MYSYFNLQKYFFFIFYISRRFFFRNIPEVYRDFSKKKDGEMIINLYYNETLIKEKKKLENNYNPYSDNIMVLYIDSL